MMEADSIFGTEPDRLRWFLKVGREEDETVSEDVKPPATSLARLMEKPGARIGRYKLLRVLGEGGMGTVYLAEQGEPVGRQVALKIVKPGMDSKRVIARFEAEQKALALMEHAHIAHVYDAGLTANGRPYFVMEYVKGAPITEHCDKHKLTIEERLRLFLHVCEAVQHAHQKGIIHRDLKPSNILVSTEDNEAVPKVIDFGVARAIEQSLTAETLYTEEGQLIGTPQYMSPEQADLNNQDIDTRTDIYALGVMLYELLAGVPPFDRGTFRTGGIEHIRKIICEEEPKTPSTRLGKTSLEELAESARQRKLNSGALQRRLRGDLDWIALKALEKDRTRRYASAGELAADITGHLNHEPVLASPPGAAYRLNKFVRRHKGIVAGTVAVLAVSLIGTVVSTIFAVGQARARAEAQAVSDILRNSVLESLDSYRVGGREITIRSVLDTTSESLSEKKLERWPLAEAEIHHTLGFAYWSLGLYEQAESHDKRALEIYRAHLNKGNILLQSIIKNLGWVYFDQCQFEEAETLFIEAVETALQVKDEDNWWDTPISMNMLASLRCVQGRFREADELASKALQIFRTHMDEENGSLVYYMDTLACSYHFQGRYEEAEQLFSKALEISQQQQTETDWHRLIVTRRFGELCWYLGRYDEAEQFLTKVLNSGRVAWDEQHPERLKIMASLGWLYHSQGWHEQAEDVLSTTLKSSQQVLGNKHTTTARCMHGLGTVYLSQGQYDQAEPLLTNAWKILCRILGEENWASLSIKNTLGKLHTARGYYAEAEKSYVETIEAQCRKLGDDHPETLETKNDLAMLYKEQAKYQEAEDLLLAAVEGRRLKLGDTHPDTLESWHTLVELYEAWGKPEEAEQWRAKLRQTEAVEE